MYRIATEQITSAALPREYHGKKQGHAAAGQLLITLRACLQHSTAPYIAVRTRTLPRKLGLPRMADSRLQSSIYFRQVLHFVPLSSPEGFLG